MVIFIYPPSSGRTTARCFIRTACDGCPGGSLQETSAHRQRSATRADGVTQHRSLLWVLRAYNFRNQDVREDGACVRVCRNHRSKEPCFSAEGQYWTVDQVGKPRRAAAHRCPADRPPRMSECPCRNPQVRHLMVQQQLHPPQGVSQASTNAVCCCDVCTTTESRRSQPVPARL